MKNDSYRERFGLSLPPSGTKVTIEYMAGSQFSIIWTDCPDKENVLYMWLPKKTTAIDIINEHGWSLIDKKTLIKSAKQVASLQHKEISALLARNKDNSNKTIISLFDYSGNWSEPWKKAGFHIMQLDIKKGFDVLEIMNDVMQSQLEAKRKGFQYVVYGVLAAPPCTDFAVSGAKYWKYKEKLASSYNNPKTFTFDSTVEHSLALVYATLEIIEQLRPLNKSKFFWSLENPVGRMAKLVPELGEPYYFNPCDFAGYLNLTSSDHNELDRIRRKDGMNVTRDEINFVLKCEAYTKKTGLWGDFNRNLIKKPIEPVRVCKQGSPIQTFGGKSCKTKEERSFTPKGFSKAFYEANK